MAYVRLVVEFLLRLLLGVARLAFLALGLAAVGPALMLAPQLTRSGAEPWITALTRPALVAGGVFLAGGLLLVAARWLVPGERSEPVDPPVGSWTGGGWSWLVGPVLLGLAGGAALVSGRLLQLWGEIAAFLDRAGVWREVQRAGDFSGLVLFPVLFVLAAPLLETAAAVFLVAAPVLLAGLFATRSALFRRSLLMTVVCQVVLVATSLLAAEMLAGVLREVARHPELTADAEGRGYVAGLLRMRDVVRATGADYAWLAAGSVLLLTSVLWPRRAAPSLGADPRVNRA